LTNRIALRRVVLSGPLRKWCAREYQSLPPYRHCAVIFFAIFEYARVI